MDIDDDKKLTADDFLGLDEQSFTEKSSKGYKLVKEFENLVQNQLGNLKKVIIVIILKIYWFDN